MEPYWTAAPFKESASNGSQGRFPFVKTGRTDHGRTSQFENEMKNVLLRAYYLGFDWSGWRVLIKSEIIIATGMVWPVRSDKWKAS